MLFTDAGIHISKAETRRIKRRIKKNEDARKLRILLKLFDDNPDKEFERRHVVELTGIEENWVSYRLKMLTKGHDSYIENRAGDESYRYVFVKRKEKAPLISRALSMGKWGA